MFIGIGVNTRSSAGNPKLLDRFGNLEGAYGLFRLRSAYTGALIRVRRSNDNAELDIGSTPLGELDTATLTAFVGANSGFVSVVYDQSGLGRNYTQATPASQPRIVNAGTIDTRSGKPFIRFDGTDDFLSHSTPSLYAANGSTVIAAVNLAAVANALIFSENNSGSANPIYWLAGGDATTGATTRSTVRNDANGIFLNVTGTLNVADGTTKVFSVVDGGASVSHFINGATSLSNASYTRTGVLTLNNSVWGAAVRTSNTNFLNGLSEALILMNTALAPSDRAIIEAALMARYGL